VTILAGCSIILFSVLSLVFFCLLVKKIIDMNFISLATIFGPVKYTYIQMILLIFLTICSTSFVFLLVKAYIRKVKKAKENKTSKKEDEKEEELEDSKEYAHKEKTTQWRMGETKELDPDFL